MKTMTLKEWKKKAKSLFGSDPLDWEFKCVQCGHIQKGRDFQGVVDDPMNMAFFSCIGRWKKGVGCDWTLGGLLRIHELEVEAEDGKHIPVFEFAEEPKTATIDEG